MSSEQLSSGSSSLSESGVSSSEIVITEAQIDDAVARIRSIKASVEGARPAVSVSDGRGPGVCALRDLADEVGKASMSLADLLDSGALYLEGAKARFVEQDEFSAAAFRTVTGTEK